MLLHNFQTKLIRLLPLKCLKLLWNKKQTLSFRHKQPKLEFGVLCLFFHIKPFPYLHSARIWKIRFACFFVNEEMKSKIAPLWGNCAIHKSTQSWKPLSGTVKPQLQIDRLRVRAEMNFDTAGDTDAKRQLEISLFKIGAGVCLNYQLLLLTPFFNSAQRETMEHRLLKPQTAVYRADEKGFSLNIFILCLTRSRSIELMRIFAFWLMQLGWRIFVISWKVHTGQAGIASTNDSNDLHSMANYQTVNFDEHFEGELYC